MAIDAATLAEIQRKANQNIALTAPTADKQAAYDAARAATNKEIERKASNNIALTSNSSQYNTDLYNSLLKNNFDNAPNNTPNPAPNNTAQNHIDSLNTAKRDATIAALGKSRDAALSNLGAEKSAIQPKYYDARNQAAAGSQQAFRNFAEYMAARGGTNAQGVSAGSAAQAELTRNMNLQGSLGNLSRQEAQAFTDIERRSTDVNNAYESDVASASAGMEADRMKMLLDDYYQAQQRGDQLAQLAIQNEIQRAGLTGTYQGAPTMDAKNNQFNQDMQTRQFEYQQARDQIADQRYKLEFDEDVRRYGLDYALRKAETNSMIANRAADNDRQSANANAIQSAKPLTISQVDSMIKSGQFIGQKVDTYGKPISGTSEIKDPAALESFILSLDLSDSIARPLYIKYNLKWGD